MSPRPSRNAGSRRTGTSRSRLVTTPCSPARASAAGEPPGRLRRGSAPRRSPWPASRRSASRPRCRPRSRRRAAARRGPAGRTRRSRRGRRRRSASRSAAASPGPGPRRRGAPRSRGRAGRSRPAPERLALGDQQLQLDQVQPGDGLGDRVLDLEAGVHLEEEEALASPGSRGTRRCRRRRSRSPRRPPGGLVQGRTTSAARSGAGASSTTFWCRRWIEQSRSPSTTTVPCVSPTICTSTWRPRSTYGSTKTVPSPNADSASAAACRSHRAGRPARARCACRGRRRPPTP